MPQPGQLRSTRAGSPQSIGAAIEQKIRYITDPRTGGRTIRTFHGSGQALLNLVANFEANGWTTDLHGRGAGPEWELICEIGYIWNNNSISDNPFSTWELTSNKVEKDFLNAQNSLVASLSSSDIKILQSYIQNPQFPPPAANTLKDDAGNTPSTAGVTAYALILAGVTSQKIFQPVLTQNLITSNVYAIAASFANVGSIISSANLALILPGQLAFTMPADPQYGKTGFAYGWLKNYPNVTVAAFNKTQIRQDYEFGLWSQAMYVFA